MQQQLGQRLGSGNKTDGGGREATGNDDLEGTSKPLGLRTGELNSDKAHGRSLEERGGRN